MSSESTSRAELSASVGFAVNPLLRHSERRHDDAEIARYRADDSASAVIMLGDKPLLKKGRGGFDSRFALAEVERLGEPRELPFLGTIAGRPLFLANFDPATAEAVKDYDDLVVADLRALAMQGALPPDELGPLGEAKALGYWHQRHRFCSNCGAPSRPVSGGWRRDCDACKAQHFPRTDPVVIMLAVRGDECLLGRQPQFPRGMYSCLAGFVEPGETLEDAVRREIMEEAGVPLGAVRYLASQPWPFPASLMIGCVGEALSSEIVIDRTELDDARWFSREEARLMLAGRHPGRLYAPPPMAIAHHVLAAFVRGEAD
ncbi:NAD(+) diphosphatase [Chelatococcus reniformis]|uniref:NAD(+) diphosphatase n=1 Tax=Chelatococcus reniformis TaxID=1494448 RepID=A0A916XKZ7_9HYPH|nr:NAD(+) diphosphatase [Chelatococcus reniformis]GGC79880.1 NADH pyrophosphatase [Chelatococcus reniformis]